MEMTQKASLLSMLLTLSDSVLKGMGVRQASLNNLITEAHFGAFVKDEERAELNLFIFDKLKEELLSGVDLSEQALEQLDERFDELRL